jgi:hypothetical protein
MDSHVNRFSPKTVFSYPKARNFKVVPNYLQQSKNVHFSIQNVSGVFSFFLDRKLHRGTRDNLSVSDTVEKSEDVSCFQLYNRSGFTE